MQTSFKRSKYREHGKIARRLPMSEEQKALIARREQEAKDRLRAQMMKSFGIGKIS